MIELKLLGPVEVWAADGRELTSVLIRPKALALLAYLALEGLGTYQRRDKLLALLWPELDQHGARHALRQLLYELRQAVGEEVILTRGTEDVALSPAHLRSDAAALESALARGEHAHAQTLYRGELLDGFHLSGAPEFEQWLDRQRARLKGAVLEAAGELRNRAAAADDLGAAVRWAERALTLDPFDEPALRALLTLLDRRGDRANALLAFAAYERQVNDQLGVAPAPETMELVAALRERTETNHTASEAMPAPADAAKTPPRRRGRSASLAAVSVLATAVLSGVLLTRISRREVEDGIPRLVVLPFEDATGDARLAGFGPVATDWLGQGIARTGLIQVVGTEATLQTARAGSGDPSGTALDAAGRLKARLVLTGRYVLSGTDLQVGATLLDGDAGTVLGAIEPIVAPAPTPAAALEPLRRAVLGLVAFHVDARVRPWAEAARRPPGYDAYLAFVGGLAASPRTEKARAFDRAAALDTGFVEALVQRALVATSGECDSLVTRAEAAGARLAEVDRYRLAAHKAFCRNDRANHYLNVREAARRAPEVWPAFVSAALNYGAYAEVDSVLARADLPEIPRAAVTADSAYWQRFREFHQFVTWHFLGRHEAELALARRARQARPREGGPFDREATALAALGRIGELDSLLAHAAIDIDHGTDPAEVLWYAGIELDWHGHARAGRGYLERTEAMLRTRWEELNAKKAGGREDWVLADLRPGSALVDALLRLERWNEARALADSLNTVSAALDGFDNPVLLTRAGIAAARAGDTVAAVRYWATLEELFRLPALADRPGAEGRLSELAGALGRCAEAAELLSEALRHGWSHPMIHRWHFGYYYCRDFGPMRRVWTARGARAP